MKGGWFWGSSVCTCHLQLSYWCAFSLHGVNGFIGSLVSVSRLQMRVTGTCFRMIN